MRVLFHRFFGDCAGATAIEYALIATVLSLAAIAGFATMANSVQSSYEAQGDAVEKAWTRHR